MYSAQNLQNWHKYDELKDIYTCIRKSERLEEKFTKLEEPIMIQWWLIRACASFFLEYKSTWEWICNDIWKLASKKSTAFKVTSSAYMLTQEKVILSNMTLRVAIHKWILFSHFVYAHIIFVCYFLMVCHIESAMKQKCLLIDEFVQFEKKHSRI